MAARYAKEQGPGYNNYIHRIAIVGAAGQVGKFIAEALLKTGKHKLSAITRSNSASVIPEGIEVKKVNYENHESLVKALQGQEALVITMGALASPDQQTKLIAAAAAAAVPWVLPNEYGIDMTVPGLSQDVMIDKSRYYAQIEELGQSHWIAVNTGFWYEFSLSGSPERFGFDFKDRSVIMFDDGNVKINTSTWPQCGRAVANLLSLKVLPEDEHDRSATLSQYTDKHVYVSSFTVSQKDMFASVLRVSGTTEKDWTVTYENTKERYDSGRALRKQGNRQGFARALYTRNFYPDGNGDFGTRHGLQNDALNLPKEDLDEYTKLAIEMSKEQ